MFKMSSDFALGALLVSEVKEAIGAGARFGRMRRSRGSALLLLKAYAMYSSSKRLISSLER